MENFIAFLLACGIVAGAAFIVWLMLFKNQ